MRVSQEAQKGDNEKKITYLEQRLDVEFGTFKLTDAYEEAVNYPYRPGAIKAVIAIMASPCEKSPLPLSVRPYNYPFTTIKKKSTLDLHSMICYHLVAFSLDYCRSLR